MFQFSLSIIFIAGTLIISSQLNYVRSRNLGFDQEQVVHFMLSGLQGNRFQAFKDELLQSPEILGVTRSSDALTYTVHSTGAFFWEGKGPEDHLLVHQFSIDHDYVKTLGMEIVAGRDLSREFPTDTTRSFLVNETLAKILGYEDPIGKSVTLYNRTGPIVGVIKDFNFKSLHHEIEPLAIIYLPGQGSYANMKISDDQIPETLNEVAAIWEELAPGFPFDYHFLYDKGKGIVL